jgi:hypothetical protein
MKDNDIITKIEVKDFECSLKELKEKVDHWINSNGSASTLNWNSWDSSFTINYHKDTKAEHFLLTEYEKFKITALRAEKVIGEILRDYLYFNEKEDQLDLKEEFEELFFHNEDIAAFNNFCDMDEHCLYEALMDQLYDATDESKKALSQGLKFNYYFNFQKVAHNIIDVFCNDEFDLNNDIRR